MQKTIEASTRETLARLYFELENLPERLSSDPIFQNAVFKLQEYSERMIFVIYEAKRQEKAERGV